MFSLILVLSLLNYILILWSGWSLNSICDLSRKSENSEKPALQNLYLNKKSSNFFLSRIETICWFKSWLVENTICELAYSSPICELSLLFFLFLGFVGITFLNGRKKVWQNTEFLHSFQPCGLPSYNLLLIWMGRINKKDSCLGKTKTIINYLLNIQTL